MQFKTQNSKLKIEKMDLIRDVLDNQVVDRNGRNMGRVDGIIGELRPGQPVRVAFMEMGPPTLAGRLHPKLGKWVDKRMPKVDGRKSGTFRIPWSKVSHVGINVEVDLDADQTEAMDWE